MDPSLLKGLFIQRLPSNIRMNLASTAKGSNLQELAAMADSVMKVISPSIATMATPQTTELGELKTKVASLRRQLLDLQVKGWHRRNSRSNMLGICCHYVINCYCALFTVIFPSLLSNGQSMLDNNLIELLVKETTSITCGSQIVRCHRLFKIQGKNRTIGPSNKIVLLGTRSMDSTGYICD